jgi:hypothetical protein
MLSNSQINAIREMIYWAENQIRLEGGCDHEANICFCGVTANIIELYEIWHNDVPNTCTWVGDYVWDANGQPTRILRCDKCYVEKSTT